MDERGGFAKTYGIELLYRQLPDLDRTAVLHSLRKRCPDVQPLDPTANDDLLAFVYPDHPVQLADATLAAQIFIAPTEKPETVDDLEPALQQSWDFPQALEAVSRTTKRVLFTDLMSSALPYQERLDIFTRSLLGFLELAPPEAIHWAPAGRIVNPIAYLRAAKESPAAQWFAGPVNVRFFNIQSPSGDMLMDSLGLAALGLPDLQCHFRKLDPDDVARMLYNLSLYLFEEGDVIDDGHTIDGVDPGSKWSAQHEESLLAPKRVVLDLNPGQPYAAGKRA